MTDIEISFQKAVQTFNSSDLDLAIELFKTIVSQSPDHIDAHIYLGQAHFKKEDYQDSVNCLKKALEIDPDHFQAKESLEVVQWKMEDLSDTTSEEAENIENVNQDTLKPSSDFSSQDATSALKERDDQINPNTSIPSVIGATESGHPQFIRNSQITFMARSTLKGNWNKAVLASLVYLLIEFATEYIFGQVSPYVLSLLLGTELVTKLEFPYSLLNSFLAGFLHSFINAPLTLGYSIYILSAYRKKNYQWDLIFAGFSFQYYFLVLSASWLITAFTMVGMVFFIIPGIIIPLALIMVYFIIVDNPDISPLEALKKSYQMMKGFKWKFCCLGFRFIGWLSLAALPGIGLLWIDIISVDNSAVVNFLAGLPAGIGLLWVIPYFLMSTVIFYENISGASKSQSPQSLELETVIS